MISGIIPLALNPMNRNSGGNGGRILLSSSSFDWTNAKLPFVGMSVPLESLITGVIQIETAFVATSFTTGGDKFRVPLEDQ